MNWNDQQKAIFAAIEDSQGPHLIVSARAGTGKTTTNVGGIAHVDPDYSILLCAFNKAIQVELQERVNGMDRDVTVRTLHSIGFAALQYKVGKLRVDGNRTRDICDKTIPQPFKSRDKKERREAANVCARVVGLAKNTLAESVDAIEGLCYDHGIGDEDHEPADLATWAFAVLERCRDVSDGAIDFDDMIWLPSQLKAAPRIFDVVFVDEAQDLNPAQLWIVRKLIRGAGRLVAVGDDRQAIYGWRGAGVGVLDQLRRDFEADQLPLSVTYRCPRKVVALAQEIVPDYTAAPSAPEGTIGGVDRAAMLTKATPGDFVLSRTNAPLVGVCLALLRAGTAAAIAGRDIGATLAALIKKSGISDVPEFLIWLKQYIERERIRLEDQTQALELVEDRIACLIELCEGEASTADVSRRIFNLFTDPHGNARPVVLCSTVHRAKGLEADRVWILSETFRRGKIEEDNIYYVAITRAKSELMFVGGIR